MKDSVCQIRKRKALTKHLVRQKKDIYAKRQISEDKKNKQKRKKEERRK